MKKLDIKDRGDKGIIDFIKNKFGGEIINENEVVLDNDLLKGRMIAYEEDEYRVTLIDHTAKVDTVHTVYHDSNYDLSVHLFLNDVDYDEGKKKVNLNLPNGFIFIKGDENFSLNYKEGETKRIVTYAINYSKYENKDLMQKLTDLGKYIFHPGNDHLLIWKKSVQEKLRENISPIIFRTWVRIKLTELKLLVDNILLNLEDKQKSKLFSNYELEAINKIHEYMLENLKNKITVTSFVKEYGINKIKLNAVFKAVYGDTMYKYFQVKKAEALKDEVMNSDKTITELSFDYSYTDVNHLTKNFVAYYGVTPNEMRKNRS